MKDVKEIAKFIENSVDYLLNGEETNCRLKLDDRLAVFVGWSEGYGDELRDDVIQAKDEPDFGINAGIKVWTSDDMWTDFDYLNFPYYENEEVLDMSTSIEKRDLEEGCVSVAKTLINWYNEVKDLEIEEDGKIVEDKEQEEVQECNKKVVENLNSNPYKEVIAEYFDYSGDFDFLEIVSNVIDRIDDFNDEDGIYEAVDSSLVYYDDQWRILRHYCNPQDANWEEAIELFLNDIAAICDEISRQEEE